MLYDMAPIGHLIIAAIVLALVVLIGLLCFVGKLFEALGRFEEWEEDYYCLDSTPDPSQTWCVEVNHA